MLVAQLWHSCGGVVASSKATARECSCLWWFCLCCLDLKVGNLVRWWLGEIGYYSNYVVRLCRYNSCFVFLPWQPAKSALLGFRRQSDFSHLPWDTSDCFGREHSLVWLDQTALRFSLHCILVRAWAMRKIGAAKFLRWLCWLVSIRSAVVTAALCCRWMWQLWFLGLVFGSVWGFADSRGIVGYVIKLTSAIIMLQGMVNKVSWQFSKAAWCG